MEKLLSQYTFEISDRQNKDLQNCIILTGAPRSGTTLLGKIVSTFQNVDYHFEPNTLYMISCLVASGQLPRPVAADLLKIYMYEDLFLDSIHGRKVNLRTSDDSYILNSISQKELDDRRQNIQNRADAMKWIETKSLRLAFKIPNIMNSLDFFCETFERSQVILIVRDGREVARSLIRKGWLKNKTLKNWLWPYQKTQNNARVPYWVETDHVQRWLDWNEATRACYMWTMHAKIAHNFANSNPLGSTRFHIVRYDHLLAEPVTIVERLIKFLNCSLSPTSQARMDEIKKPDSSKEGNLTDFYDQVDAKVLKDFQDTNQLWGYQ